MFKTTKETTQKIIIVLIAIFIAAIISPFIVFWVCYLGGFIVKWLIGNVLVQGFALFGLILPVEKIPLACGTLGFVASYFKTNSKCKYKKVNLNKRLNEN